MLISNLPVVLNRLVLHILKVVGHITLEAVLGNQLALGLRARKALEEGKNITYLPSSHDSKHQEGETQ